MNDAPAASRVLPLASCWTPVRVWERFSRLPHCLFLDSALPHASHGRYSFVMADPFDVIVESTPNRETPLELKRRMARFATGSFPELPPFQGGLAGLFGYEWGGCFEQIPVAAIDEFEVPLLAVGLYDVVAAFDRKTNQGWLISQGFPEVDLSSRGERAEARLRFFHDQVLGGQVETEPAATRVAPIAADSLASQYPTIAGESITSTFSRDQYEAAVARVIEYIRNGDVFQVNLAQRLLAPHSRPSIEIYQALRKRNPAPFAAYFDMGDFQILSASPERFLRCHDRIVHTHPIKGTRHRSPHAEADLFAGGDLLASEKDRAENTMIVDLLRNDLSRVCRADSVYVEQWCGLERYQFVQHLVSVIRGELSDRFDALDLLAVSFPGGSITGAPKIRAMEIIAELEPTVRGPYCGSLAYIGFDGRMDSSILIRTVTVGRGWCQLPVGGGIVALSQPRHEFEETWHKARGLVEVVS